MYLPLNSSYAPYTVFIAALARRADASMPLLPNGTLRMRKLDEVEVERDGTRRRVQLLAQTGLWFQPTMRASEVVQQGFDELQHINQLMLNFLVTPETDTRTLERFRLPAELVDGLDFDSAPVRDFIALLASRQTVVDPTLATFDFMQQKDGDMPAAYAAVADHLPPVVRRNLFVGSMNIPDAATNARYKRSYAKMVDSSVASTAPACRSSQAPMRRRASRCRPSSRSTSRPA